MLRKVNEEDPNFKFSYRNKNLSRRGGCWEGARAFWNNCDGLVLSIMSQSGPIVRRNWTNRAHDEWDRDAESADGTNARRALK